MSIPLEALKAIPYLDISHLGGRTAYLMPLWDGNRWRQWVSMPAGVMEIKVVDMVEADYVATSAAKPTDLLIPFFEMMWQRASWPEVCPLICAICDDFRNLGISVAKLRFFFENSSNIPSQAVSRSAQTELEYLLVTSRGIFDFLQETISTIWKGMVRLHDPTAEAKRRARKLPETFFVIALADKRQPRSASEIEARYGLPTQLAEQYANMSPFFALLRDARDAVVHGGHDFGPLFHTERGFCVDPRMKPFSCFQGWSPEHHYNQNLVSVLPWVANMILRNDCRLRGIDERFRLSNSVTPAYCSGLLCFPPWPTKRRTW